MAQGEGCEQGDPLAPALFALGQHSALCSAASALHPAETLVAFLDDLYVVTTRGRARECRDTVVGAVERDCGIASNIGKTRVYGPTESPPPPGVAELGPDVWRADKPLAERGLKVLGVPIGHAEYVRAWAEARMQEEQELLDQLPQLPDLQCAWLLFAMCAAPRANHALRTVPPTMVAPYAKMHDDAIWDTLDALLGGLSPDETASARALAELPASLGGLGLVSAQRTAPAAYWAGWADALPVLRRRLPAFAESCADSLAEGGRQSASLEPAAAARALLQDEGWHACPEWRAVLEGARSPRMRDTSLGDWPHGWQSHASRIRNLHFRERVFLPTLPPSASALVRSQAGPHRGLADSGAH